MLDYLVLASLLAGAFFTLVGSIGLMRLPDFRSRLHAPTKATTLGAAGILLAAALYFADRGDPGARELLILLFLFMTAPVSAFLLMRTAIHAARAMDARDREPPPPR